MGDLVGRVLAGRFELMRLLDEAEEASLYEAVQLDVGRRVAIKVLAEGGDEADAARLRQEAYAMATIDDPHVAKILEIGGGEATGEPTFLVMERRTGETLEGKPPLKPERAVHVAFQIAHALEAAHAVGIIHRDVRPANVRLVRTAADDAFVELGGFGLAKALHDDDSVKTRATITARRTRDRFTPPEGNAREGAGPATDIFGAGMCLQTLLAETPDASLASIIAKATATDPKERYGSAAELKAALKEWKPRVDEPTKPQARYLLPFIVAAVVSTTLAVGVAALIIRDRQGPPSPLPPPPLPLPLPAPSGSVVESATPPPEEPVPASAEPSAPPAPAPKPAAKPPRGSFVVMVPLQRIPAAEGEAWRVATTKKVNTCVKAHGLGECAVKSIDLLLYLEPDGTVRGTKPYAAHDAEKKACSIPEPLAECLAQAPNAKVSKPSLKAGSTWIQFWHRAEIVE